MTVTRIALLFIGRAGAGKSTAAQVAQATIGQLGIYPMAEGVKEVAFSMGWDGRKDARGRRLLQEIGSVGRQYDKDMWVAQAMDRWLRSSHPSFAADDVRYLNEIEYVRRAFKNTFVIRVDRDGGVGDGLDETNAAHISEQFWSSLPADLVIENNQGKDRFAEVVREVVTKLYQSIQEVVDVR